MGICFTLILQDEMNWGYVDADKEAKLSEFEKEYKEAGGYCTDKVGEWYGFVVYDVDKCGPYNIKFREIIKKFSENAWFISDLEPWKIINIDEFFKDFDRKLGT